jgi:hypothetical protein
MRSYITIAIVVLVVFALSGVGVYATFKVKEAAARTTCGNNLHQLALTTQKYEQFCGQYPQATMPNDRLPPEERLSWLLAIVPFIESSPRYERFDLHKGWQAPENQVPGAECIKLYRCPAGSESSAGNVTHYVGLTGIGPDAALLPKESPRAGVFGYERTISSKDITDGTSTTLLAAETAVNNGPWAAGGSATVRYADPIDQPYVGIGRPFGQLHGTQLWPGFTQAFTVAVFVDSSVRSIGPSIDPQVFEALVTIAGREQIPDEY